MLVSLVVSLTLGALPSLSSWTRASSSACILTGVITGVNSSLQGQHGETVSEPEESSWLDRYVQATVRIDTVEKDTTSKFTSSSEATIRYRRTFRRPVGWTGPQGQNADIEPETRVRCYIDKDGHLLSPNGWEPLEEEFEPITPIRATEGSQTPPLLKRRHGLSGIVELTRDVTTAECPWLSQTLASGQRFAVFTGHTYGVISSSGVAVRELDQPDDAPFFEVPVKALQQTA